MLTPTEWTRRAKLNSVNDLLHVEGKFYTFDELVLFHNVSPTALNRLNFCGIVAAIMSLKKNVPMVKLQNYECKVNITTLHQQSRAAR